MYFSIYVLVLVYFAAVFEVAGGTCSSKCGKNQACINDTCLCKDSFILHSNDKDCIDVSCDVDDCVFCEHDKCKRCVHYINKETRQCSDTCSGTADVAYDGDVIGNVCIDHSEKMDIIIGVATGVSATVLLVFLTALFLCVKVKQKRRRVKLHKSPSASPKTQVTMDYGRLKRIPIFDNIGFEPDVSSHDREEFRGEVEQLREHTDTLHLILHETRMRLRTMDSTDARVSTYKGVIHQLCRVLVLLNKKDPCISVPADGHSLIGWANQMLQDYAESHDSYTVTSCGSIRYSQFPSISLDAQGLITAVYAVPNGHVTGHSQSVQQYHLQPVSSKTPGYYSSVPVPYIGDYQQTHLPFTPDGQHSSDCSVPQSHGSYQHPSDVGGHVSGYVGGVSGDVTREPYSRTSSSSDYNHQEFTTFSGGLPWSPTRSPSLSTSYSESLINPDGLPFSLEEATEPIEV